MRVLTEKEHEETLWSDGHVPYLDWDGGYMGVYICQNSWNCTLEVCILLYINISVKKKKRVKNHTS